MSETIPKDEVNKIICKHCMKKHGFCQHRWDCPILTEIAKHGCEMLICPKCGLEVHGDFEYCPRCGSKMDGERKDEPQIFDKPPKCLGCVYSELDKSFHPCASCVDFSKYVGERSE